MSLYIPDHFSYISFTCLEIFSLESNAEAETNLGIWASSCMLSSNCRIKSRPVVNPDSSSSFWPTSIPRPSLRSFIFVLSVPKEARSFVSFPMSTGEGKPHLVPHFQGWGCVTWHTLRFSPDSFWLLEASDSPIAHIVIKLSMVNLRIISLLIKWSKL